MRGLVQGDREDRRHGGEQQVAQRGPSAEQPVPLGGERVGVERRRARLRRRARAAARRAAPHRTRVRARRAAPPRRPRARPSSASAMSQPAAIASRGEAARFAIERTHGQIVGHQHSLETDPAPDHPLDDRPRERRGTRRDRAGHRGYGRSSARADRHCGRKAGNRPPDRPRAPPAARDGCPPRPGRGRARACRPAGRRRRAARPPSRGRAAPPRSGSAPKARSPITSMRAGQAQVEHRGADHVEARPRRSRARSARRCSQAARSAAVRIGSPERADAARPAGGPASAADAGGPRGRPPGPPSARRSRGSTARRAAVSAASWPGSSTLRREQDHAGGPQARGTARLPRGRAPAPRSRRSPPSRRNGLRSWRSSSRRPWRAPARRTRSPPPCRRSRRCAGARRLAVHLGLLDDGLAPAQQAGHAFARGAATPSARPAR